MLAEVAHGGPFDGAELRPSLPLNFVWTDGRRCFRKPGGERALYRRTQNRFGDSVLIYAGFKWALCSCGAYHRRVVDACTLCGSRLPPC